MSDDNVIIKNDDDKFKKFLEPDFPLMEIMKEKISGTVHHSQTIASMVEIISKKLNLDSNLLKVSALYHDCGKLINPKYFAENQTNDENCHENLDPYISYQIISRHVSDSVSLLIEYDFPINIIKIIQQHHGSSTIKYFYQEMKKQTENDIDQKNNKLTEDDFRYKQPVPSSSEAAILMICDSVEATAKALYGNDKLKTEEQRFDLVEKTITRLKKDFQLDLLTAGAERIITESLVEFISSMYHNRPLYSDQHDEEKNKNDD